jgi:dTDP-4-dehydrorhamnose reductase
MDVIAAGMNVRFLRRELEHVAAACRTIGAREVFTSTDPV